MHAAFHLVFIHYGTNNCSMEEVLKKGEKMAITEKPP